MKPILAIGKSNIYVGDAQKFYRDVVLGLSQKEMAEITNVSQTLISRHEAGLYSATASNAYVSMGFRRFWSYVNFGHATLEEILTGKLAKRLHDDYPEEVPYKIGRYQDFVTDFFETMKGE